MGGSYGGYPQGGGVPQGAGGPSNKDTVYSDLIYQNTQPLKPQPTTNVTTNPTPYGTGAYTSPGFGMTPSSPWAGLAQQMYQAQSMAPSPWASSRTGLMDMFASPWNSLYGGPQGTPFSQMYGQDPMQGRGPVPGTPQFNGQNLPPPPPPGPPPPPPPPPPGSTNPGANPLPPGGPRVPGVNPPPGGAGGPPPPPPPGGLPGMDKGSWTPDTTGNPNMEIYRNEGRNNYQTPPGGQVNQTPGSFTTPDRGANYGYGSPTGSFMQDFGAAGGDVGRYGAVAAMMGQKINEQHRTPGGLTNQQIFEKMRGPGRYQGTMPTSPANIWKK